MAAATFGLVSGGLLGGPVATLLVRRKGLAPAVPTNALDDEIDTEPEGEAATGYTLLKTMAIILVAMALASVLSGWLKQYLTLPGYIGAMIVAAVFRNSLDASGVIRLNQRVVDDLGTVALSLFLAMALMSLKLWELLDLALPMWVILTAQVRFLGLYTYWVTFRLMGRDYAAAVMTAGHCGFGLGATPDAVANMRSVVERFGPAPQAFLVVPMVGAFFIDFSNALIITGFINWVKP